MADRDLELMKSFSATRQRTLQLCVPLEIEDHGVQSMPDVSPPKWHLGHTSWFFETILLKALHRELAEKYAPFHPIFDYVFNSYYEAVGDRVERTQRGQLGRPTLSHVHEYRHWVEEGILARASELCNEPWATLLRLGIQHEQQHQELLLMDIKHIFFSSPMQPSYQKASELPALKQVEAGVSSRLGDGICDIGHEGENFAFDNERPRHRVYLEPFRISRRPVLAGEFVEFIEAGGYENPSFWLSEGWAAVRSQSWRAPLYWEKAPWRVFTLAGWVPLHPMEPVSHVSYFEADAFARWKGARLPTEQEWEVAAEAGAIRFGEVWEWTQSAYLPYPGFRPYEGLASEYNGKFMSGQMVMRGRCAATPAGHADRLTYRNFYAPQSRWQFGGFRIAT